MTGVRQRVRVALVAALVVAAAGVGGIWAYRSSQPPPPQRPLPIAGASLHDAATAYLDAAVRQDCGFTRAMTVREELFAWCTSPTMTSYGDLGGPTVLTAEQAGGEEEQCVPFRMTSTESRDGSMQAGDQPWSLCFVSTSAGWRVANQGQG